MRRSDRLFLTLVKVMLPVMIAVQAAQAWGWIDILGQAFAPAMGLLNLPAEAGMVWMTGAFVGIYGAIAALISLAPALELTGGQFSALCSMLLFAHALPVEQAIVRRAGASFWATAALRVGRRWATARRSRGSATPPDGSMSRCRCNGCSQPRWPASRPAAYGPGCAAPPCRCRSPTSSSWRCWWRWTSWNAPALPAPSRWRSRRCCAFRAWTRASRRSPYWACCWGCPTAARSSSKRRRNSNWKPGRAFWRWPGCRCRIR